MMTFELSQQMKILVLAAVVLVVGGAGVFVLSQSGSGSKPVTTAAPHVRTPAHHHVTAPHAPAGPTLLPGLPVPVRAGLAHSKVVVAVLYAPGDPVDAYVLAQARAGARQQHTKVVTLNVRNDAVAGATAAWMANIVEPAVLVVTRPGRIVVELDGYADSGAVAQAVADARS